MKFVSHSSRSDPPLPHARFKRGPQDFKLVWQAHAPGYPCRLPCAPRWRYLSIGAVLKCFGRPKVPTTPYSWLVLVRTFI
jgi:hypothetical protein